jgi:hypothetical protein
MDLSLIYQENLNLPLINKIPPNFEDLIVKEAKRTGFRYRKIKGLFEKKYSLSFSKSTIKGILKRNGISSFSFIIFVILWLRAHNVRGKSMY